MKWLSLVLFPLALLTLGAVLAVPVKQQTPPMVLQKLNALEEKVAILEQDIGTVATEVEQLRFGAQEVVATPVPAGNTFEEACINGTLPLLPAGTLGAIRFPEGSEWGVAPVPGMDVGGIYRDITGGRAPTWDSRGISPGGFGGPVIGSNHDFANDGDAEVCLMVSPGYTVQIVHHSVSAADPPQTVFEEGNHYLQAITKSKYLLKATGLKNNRAIVVRLLE